jgi:Flp pilus assembly protein TadG
MIKKPIVAKKSKAQALVEFALILTLLLTLLYGILEAGRLMFIYASTVTAARQATRYGSATGNNTAGIPYYKDCAGIRNAAKRVGFLAPFADANIVITYDTGPGTADLAWTCAPGAAFSGGTAATGDRVKVCVSTTWAPIVGALVPLRWSGVQNCGGTVTNNAITKRSERTIISSVTIGVTAVPGSWTGSGNLSLTVEALPWTYSAVGQLITYRYTMRNTGAIDLAGPFTLTANNTSTTCGAGTTLFPGQTLVCVGTYYITQADMDEGVVVSLTIATGSGASSDQISTTIIADQIKQLSLTKSASPTSASTVGAIIKYTYILRNSGNVTLTPPYTVTDNKASVNCSSIIDAMAPGGTITCTADDYLLKQNPDINDGVLVNTATATAKFGTDTITSNQAQATVYTSKLVLTVNTTPSTATAKDQVIAYQYVIYNNSGGVATSPAITISSPNFPAFTVSCPAAPIPDKSSITCTPVATTPATYTVTQANIDAGTTLTHTATASANNGGAITSRAVNVSVPVIRNDALSLTISATTPAFTGPPTVLAVGNTFTFNYMLTNTGNTTLTSPYTITPSTIRDGGAAPLHTALSITCGTGDLLPGASTAANFCSATAVSATANDLNGTYGFYITNLATAKAKTKVGARDVASTQQTGLVATFNGARLALGITANPSNAPSAGMPIEFTYTLTSTGNTPVILPSPYSIAWAITIGATAGPSDSFACNSPLTTIPIGSSTECTGKSSYTTVATPPGNITNTATAPATNAPLATAQAIVTRSFLCNITHSGPVPDTDPNPGINKDHSTWTIYNHTGGTVHIDQIYITWATLNRDLKSVSLSGASIWEGVTSQGLFILYSGTNSSPPTGMTWPVAFNTGTQSMVFSFSGITTGIQVTLQFTETSCGYLESDNPAQREPCTLPGSTTLSGSQTNGNVSLNWTASSGATGYKIYKSTDNFSFVLLTTVGDVTSANNVDTIASSTTQYYRIVPTSTCGDGATSNTVTITRPVIRTVSGTITETVGNRTPADITITGSAGGSCSKPTTSTYTCTMDGGSGSLIVGAYSTNWNNASQKTSRDNMVCLLNPVTTYGTPWGATAGTTGATDTTTFTFSNLSADVTFNILIAQQSVGTPSGYTCYPGTIP